MRFMSAITRLPKDMLDVEHILPFWFTYLYWFLWVLGIALIAGLLIYLFVKTIGWLNSLNVDNKKKRELAREFSRERLKTIITKIKESTLKDAHYREGCHQLAATLRKFYDIHLKKDIEEMTATEIQREIRERTDLGEYFMAMRALQFETGEPSKEDFLEKLELTMKVVR